MAKPTLITRFGPSPSLPSEVAIKSYVDGLTGPVNFTDLIGTIALAQIANLLITPVKINQDGATDGQVLTWSTANGQWEPQAGGGGVSGDLDFLSIKEAAGDLLHAEGTRTGAGTITSIVPANGKTFFLAGWTANSETITGGDQVELQIDSVVIEGQFYAAHDNPYAKAMSLVGDGAKIVRLEIAGGTGRNGFLEGWVVDT